MHGLQAPFVYDPKKGVSKRTCLSKAASLALFVPAPSNPMAKMELCATSASASCENLLNVSRMFNCGFDTEIKPRARGTARRIAGSQYRRRCPKWRKSISEPMSSPMAIRAKPNTAMVCCEDRSGKIKSKDTICCVESLHFSISK